MRRATVTEAGAAAEAGEGTVEVGNVALVFAKETSSSGYSFHALPEFSQAMRLEIRHVSPTWAASTGLRGRSPPETDILHADIAACITQPGRLPSTRISSLTAPIKASIASQTVSVTPVKFRIAPTVVHPDATTELGKVAITN